MSNIKDKLIEIANKCIADNSDNTQLKYGLVLIDCNDFDHACEDIADIVIDRLPELLADSEWVKLPCKVGNKVYFIDYDDSLKNIIVERVVDSVLIDKIGTFLTSDNTTGIARVGSSKPQKRICGQLGKTVFLTQSEAEEFYKLRRG